MENEFARVNPLRRNQESLRSLADLATKTGANHFARLSLEHALQLEWQTCQIRQILGKLWAVVPFATIDVSAIARTEKPQETNTGLGLDAALGIGMQSGVGATFGIQKVVADGCQVFPQCHYISRSDMNKNKNNGYKYRKVSLKANHNDSIVEFKLYILSTPNSVNEDDSSATVYQSLSSGWRKGYFVCYPSDSDESSKTWNQPVEWQDDQLLYVPSLTDQSIKEAVKYIIDNGFADLAFEESTEPTEPLINFDPIPQEFRDEASLQLQREKIYLNTFNSLVMLKLSGVAKTSVDLRNELMDIVIDILDENSFNNLRGEGEKPFSDGLDR